MPNNRALEFGSFIAVFFIISIYISTYLSTILPIILTLIWLFLGYFKKLPETIKAYPVIIWSLLLFSCFIFGISYSESSISESLFALKKYRELCFIPILLPFFSIERYRNKAWNAFIIASLLILLTSYLMYFEIIEPNRSGDESLKSRISSSIFIAFFAFFCLHKTINRKKHAYFFFGLFLLCIHDLFFIVEGRTGELITIFLVILFALQRLSNQWRAVVLLSIVICLGLFLTFADKSNRINEGIINTQEYFKPIPQTNTSMGIRYTLWANSLKLIAEKPIFGHGTGSFPKEYQRITNNLVRLANPHNEFCMIGVQLGVFGLILYFGFLSSIFIYSKRSPDSEKFYMQGLLVSLVIASIFNSPILDHTEGHWFMTMIALCLAATNKMKCHANNGIS